MILCQMDTQCVCRACVAETAQIGRHPFSERVWSVDVITTVLASFVLLIASALVIGAK